LGAFGARPRIPRTGGAPAPLAACAPVYNHADSPVRSRAAPVSTGQAPHRDHRRENPVDTAVGVGITGILIAILIWCAVGLVIGILARFLMPGPDPMGIGATILLGIVGSILGGLVAMMLRIDGLIAFVPSILAAMLVLWIQRRRKRGKIA
jgi:uncharacterized membrane protein YeaQ/YmgE (transglycosylase-associated protein family)